MGVDEGAGVVVWERERMEGACGVGTRTGVGGITACVAGACVPSDWGGAHCVGVLFFFSSRRRHTRLQGDWSSDVCSSDLGGPPAVDGLLTDPGAPGDALHGRVLVPLLATQVEGGVEDRATGALAAPLGIRSEERRVGKECRSRWSPYH